MAKALYPYKMLVALHKFYDNQILADFLDTEESQYTFITIGITDKDIDKLKDLQKRTICTYIPLLCVDAANGQTVFFEQQIAKIRKLCPYTILMAGNVATPEMTQQLLLNGVDIVKIGIGPGELCTTRKVTGVGYPQLSAIIECADAAHGNGGLLCADGGLKSPGDFCKAFCAGADFVMSGSYFAGTDECEGEWVERQFWDMDQWRDTALGPKTIARKRLKVYGMSSKECMDKHYGGVKDYRTPEGTAQWIDAKGSVSGVLQEILGGLRSCCTYIGASRIKDMSKCATFIRVK
jgi:GMP reductase